MTRELLRGKRIVESTRCENGHLAVYFSVHPRGRGKPEAKRITFPQTDRNEMPCASYEPEHSFSGVASRSRVSASGGDVDPGCLTASLDDRLTADYDVETSFSRERPESNAGDAGVSQSSEAYLSKNGFKEMEPRKRQRKG